MVSKKVLFIIVSGFVFIFGLGGSILFAHAQMERTAQVHRTVYSASRSSVAKTQVVLFAPSGIRSTAAQKGDCWITSLAAPRANAWRCAVSNTIYDPCFSTSQTSSYVLCDSHPEQGDTQGLKVVLSQPLPSPDLPSPPLQQAWLLRLDNGAVCSFETGGTFLVKGLRVNYGCSDGLFVVGIPKPGAVWSVNVARNVIPNQKTPAVITTAAVLTAWI